jgi:hydrogenase nickel incorporation protein HypB
VISINTTADKSKIEVMESVYARNEAIANKLNQDFTQKNIFCVNVLGAPGAGKTTSLIRIMERLGVPACVIEGDVESDIDTEKLRSLGFMATQINTGGACKLDAAIVAKAFLDIEFSDGFIFVENIGNLICPASYLVGEHVKILICAATDGGDKPYKYPLAFERSDIILVNKSDLMPYINFDMDYFVAGVRKLNQKAPVFVVSGETGDGYEEVVDWLLKQRNRVFG